MGVHFVLYFSLLLWQMQAAASQEPDEFGCMEECGGVKIPFPFGIEPGCYNNSWFKVTCKETDNGQKPFISGIDMEILNSSEILDSLAADSVYVNNPVTYVNCGNKDNNGAAFNLKDSPFFFSRRLNLFQSVGCGNLATLSANIKTGPIANCLQPNCGDLSSDAGCSASIPENLTSYTINMTEINPGKRCTSAFVTAIYIPVVVDINKETTHVRAILQWNPVDCDLKDSLCQKIGSKPRKFCTNKCGNVVILYPFGIEEGCYMNDWYRVTCNTTDDGQKPFLSRIQLELFNVSVYKGTVLTNHPVTYFKCGNKSNNGISVNLTDSPFFYSNMYNTFWSSGCGNLATISRGEADNYLINACMQPNCGNNETFSNTGCLMTVPSNLSSFVANMVEIRSSNGHNKSCGSTFVTDKSYFNENMTIKLGRQDLTHVNATLRWGKSIRGLCDLKEDSSNCSSDSRYCWSYMSSNFLCVCTIDFNFDDYYRTDICRETGKCHSAYNYCYMLCLNTPGNNCSSTSCPDKYRYASEDAWCVQIASSTFSQHLAIIIGCTSIGTIFVLLGTWSMYKVLKRRKNTKLKQRYFKRNGGLLLQQQLSSNEGNVEKIRLFTSKELKKATDNYNKDRILGEGGQGTVYKGMLTDGSIVAIKKAKMVEEKKIDEMEFEQFINEVIILSQINHRNVVKLLGCCLETEVPLLVYEFIPNGTLSQLIHEQNEEFPMTWEMLLRIAKEIANALSYLHSAASVPIYHRDIKSSNILLDDKYKAKVSDFGISRSVAFEQTHLTTQVQGTFGYLDPEYFRSHQFTEKSDVYSFGVVLVELLTGKKPISSGQPEEVRGLVNFFLLKMKENSLFDILDPVVMNNGPEEEVIAVAKLAKRCLNLNGRKRPTMKQVAMELERIKGSEEANAIQRSMDEDSDIADVIDIASCSAYGSIIDETDGVTLHLNAYY